MYIHTPEPEFERNHYDVVSFLLLFSPLTSGEERIEEKKKTQFRARKVNDGEKEETGPEKIERSDDHQSTENE